MRSIQPLLTLLTLLVLSLPSIAQTASYSLFGNGCRASGNNSCYSPNGLFYAPVKAPEKNLRYAIQARPPLGSNLFGFELLTASLAGRPITIKVAIHFTDNFFRPSTAPAATGTMTIGTADGWYASSFPSGFSARIGTNRPFYLVFDGTSQMKRPVVSSFRATTGTHYTQPLVGSKLWSGSFINTPWAWRLMCTPQRPAVPVISNLETPRINRWMVITLSLAPQSSRALLLFGGSNTVWAGGVLPFDMGPMGALGCKLLVSPDVVLTRTTTTFGLASAIVQVPNQAGLLGVKFFNQWVVNDTGANQLGIVVSPGGVGVIGK